MISGQRGWKWQPDGGSIRLGGSPGITDRSCNLLDGSGEGTAFIKARVYGWRGLLIMAEAGLNSTTFPAYITAICWQK